MKIALPQICYRHTDIRYNTGEILRAVKRAKAAGADLVVFPELAVCGGNPMDLLERKEYVESCRRTVENIASESGDTAIILGSPFYDEENEILFNSAFFIKNGKLCDILHKTVLSDYDIFSESRYFIADEESHPIRFKDRNFRIIFDEFENDKIENGDFAVIHMGISPFSREGLSLRKNFLASTATEKHSFLISPALLSSETDVIYEGGGMIYDAGGNCILKLKKFEEDFGIIDTKKTYSPIDEKEENPQKEIYDALVFGVSQYFKNHSFKSAVLGLSGGMDSALVAAVAADALGKENVTGILMPSPYSSESSVTDALKLAENLGIRHTTIPIGKIFENFTDLLQPYFREYSRDITEENLQARIRGIIVMAFSNKFGHIALNTSNKSEIAVGYGTLYGDMCGSLSVIGDLYKTEVYKLADYINREREIIPENIMVKPPSAELRPEQKDSDSLPEYGITDGILKYYLEENLSPSELITKGFDEKTVKYILRLTERVNYKRAQSAPIIRLSKKSFGKGRQMPL